jgi:hypothetical protein
MNTDIPLDEVVTQNKYPYRQDGRQQNCQTPQKIAFEASGNRHLSKQQSFSFAPYFALHDGLRRASRTSPLLPVT